MSTQPRLLSIATAVPPFVLRREDVVERARRLFAQRADCFDRMLPIYANSGIETRHSCVPPDWYEAPSGWAGRNRLYLDNALTLLQTAAESCLRRAGVPACAVDCVVCVSTSGLATPSLEARLMERMALRPDIQRLPIFGLGCAGGALGLARAGAMARAQPGALVLLLVVELCGLTFRPDDLSNANMVATALFGDGAAAALLSTEGSGPRLSAWGEHTWPGSLDVMGWRIEDDGFGVLFSRDIPALVRERFRAATDAFLGRHGLELADIDGYSLHPGGAKVVSALEKALSLPAATLDDEREVLRRFGNMSAATLLFVLERGLAGAQPRRRLLAALGPGFTAGFLLLEAP
ncbi:MAG: type III polyketide synthase [Alphaproteobacteria bacterium]|nr:type III polyketide synthase [Alphaproteobacteria bacterium]